MSFIVKGLDMPKDEILTIQIHPDGSVYKGFPLFLNKLQAQSAEIPTPHGRLIDFTKLEFEDVAFDKVTINAPTVIESED